MPRARVRVPGRTQKKRQCRVRWGETGRSFFAKLAVSLSGRRCGPGSFAQGGRVTVRRRTRRFGHFALQPGKVFAPRRTTRRQCRAGLGRHRAADGAKRARAPPCFAVGLFVRAALWSGELCAMWPRPCPPPHAAFRTLCPQTGQSVRSEAHYAAAVPRPARLASGGGPGKTGRGATLPCRAALPAPFFRPHFPGLPRPRPAAP